MATPGLRLQRIGQDPPRTLRNFFGRARKFTIDYLARFSRQSPMHATIIFQDPSKTLHIFPKQSAQYTLRNKPGSPQELCAIPRINRLRMRAKINKDSPNTFARLPKSFTRQASQIARKSLQHPTSSLHDFPRHWPRIAQEIGQDPPGDSHHFSRKVAEESHERFHKTPQGLRQIPPRIPQGNCPRRPPIICPCLEFWKISPKSFPDNRPRMPSEILPHSIRSLHDFLRLAHNNGLRNWQISPKDFA